MTALSGEGVAKMQIRFSLNDEQQNWDITPNEPLLAALRRHGIFGVKHGCETGECGACTVLLDGRPVASCVMLAAQAEGHEITTIEALGEYPEKGWKPTQDLHPLQKGFAANGAIQCGYCTPGMIISAIDMVRRHGNQLDEATIRHDLEGNFCRCTGYQNIVKAIAAGAAAMSA